MKNVAEGQISIFDLDLQFGKTFPEPSVVTKEKISEQSSKKQRGLQTKPLQFLDLRRTNGILQEPSWEKVGQLPGESWMLNSGESPSVAVESSLSQILEDNPHQKYFLSDRACLGILRRAQKRGKELPAMLKDALEIQAGIRRNTYGETEIANAGTLLRELREVIGQETFEKWISGTITFFQSKKILQPNLYGTSELKEGKESKIKECLPGSSEVNCSTWTLQRLWNIGCEGCPPQRFQLSEQFARKLGEALQEMSLQISPEETAMHCLRSAGEGVRVVLETLSEFQKGREAREGIATDIERSFGETSLLYESHPNDSRVTGPCEISPTISSRFGTGGNNTPLVQSVGVDAYNHSITGDKAVILTASSGASATHSGPMVATALVIHQQTYCIQGNCIDRADTAGCNGKGWTEDVCYTLNTIDRPAVCAGFNGYKSVSGSIQYQEDKAATLEAHMPGNVMQIPLHNPNPTLDASYYKGTGERSGIERQIIGTYQKATGPLMANSHPGSYSGQDAYTDMFVAGLDCRTATENEDLCGTLQKNGSSLNAIHPVRIGYTVRRLTPLECERLQNYPDFWTDIEKASDSGRYKALGNSVAVCCPEYVLEGIKEVIERGQIS